MYFCRYHCYNCVPCFPLIDLAFAIQKYTWSLFSISLSSLVNEDKTKVNYHPLQKRAILCIINGCVKLPAEPLFMLTANIVLSIIHLIYNSNKLVFCLLNNFVCLWQRIRLNSMLLILVQYFFFKQYAGCQKVEASIY